jgi:hypothetical protein
MLIGVVYPFTSVSESMRPVSSESVLEVSVSPPEETVVTGWFRTGICAASME